MFCLWLGDNSQISRWEGIVLAGGILSVKHQRLTTCTRLSKSHQIAHRQTPTRSHGYTSIPRKSGAGHAQWNSDLPIGRSNHAAHFLNITGKIRDSITSRSMEPVKHPSALKLWDVNIMARSYRFQPWAPCSARQKQQLDLLDFRSPEARVSAIIPKALIWTKCYYY